MRTGWVVAAASAVLLGACAGGGTASLEAPPQAVAKKDDQFKPYREVTTPEVRVGQLPTALGLTLSARIDRQTNVVQPYLRVEVIYVGTGKRNYDSARDSGAGLLKLERLTGNAQCKPGQSCNHDEIVLIEIPEAALRQAKVSGYRLKLFARNGPEIEIGIPGPQITSLYAKIDGGAPAVAAQGPKGNQR